MYFAFMKNVLSGLARYSEAPLTQQVLASLMRGYARPHDKIVEMMKAGQLRQVKRGLYVPGPELAIASPEPFLIANHLHGPSYVSFESALEYWGMIPERTYEITSATIKRSIRYDTEVGRFSYTHLPLPYYAFGIASVELTKKQTVLMASPEKALCDKIITTAGVNLRSVRQTKEFLFEDLRIDEDTAFKLDITKIQSWTSRSPKKKSLDMLIKTLQP